MTSVDLRQGDCLAVLRDLPDNSVDAVVTDPPYGLSNTDPQRVADTIARWANGDDEYVPKGRGFMGASWDGFVPPPAVWKECLRVLKPGGHMAVFAGARTQDLMGLSIRLAGFETRDMLGWIYGSGMPKSHNVGKAIDKRRNDKQWDGWGTALKPAIEPIVLARKPLDGTVANNVLAHGVGGLNIEACRVEAGDLEELQKNWDRTQSANQGIASTGLGQIDLSDRKPSGRFPANVLMDEHAAAEMDKQSGASRFFPVFKYQSKASRRERPVIEREDGTKIQHNTVKPLALMEWLCTLITPPGGTVLDPFAGSGTTLQAARNKNFNAIGIEREPDYCELIRHRLDTTTLT